MFLRSARSAPPASAPGSVSGNPSKPGRGRGTAAALGLAGLLFGIHTLFTDSGTTIAWTWSGYPIRGPMPVPHGALTIFSLAAGLLASLGQPFSHTYSHVWYVVACAGASVLYMYDGWRGYSGGWILGVFCASVLPGFLTSAARFNPAITITSAFLIYDFLELAHVFTVAYAFVPGAQAFRERTDVVLAVTMGLVGLGVWSAKGVEVSPVGVGMRSVAKSRKTRGLVGWLMGVFVVVGVVVGWRRMPVEEPVPYNPDMQAFRAGIWTVHFGVDSGMWESQRRMKEVIEELELDIIGLLESDLQRIVLGNRDLTQYISEELGMYVDLGPGPHKHTWGAALLSKFPILNSTHHLLPSPNGELAPAIHATLDIYGSLVDVVVSHNGQEEDPLDRQLQSEELGRIMREAVPRPLIFLGYVVTKPHAEKPNPYRYLVQDGFMLDIEPADMDRWCQYILFRGVKRTAYARINRGSKPAVSDTEIQVGAFQIPYEPIDPAFIYWTKGEEHVEESLRFPPQFKGEGVRGHRYISLAEQFEGINDVIYYL